MFPLTLAISMCASWVAVQEPTLDTITANGSLVALSSGIKVEMVGVCDLYSSKTPPWGYLGKSFDPADARRFEYFISEKLSKRPWTSRSEKGKIGRVVSFAVACPTMEYPDIDISFSEGVRAFKEIHKSEKARGGRTFYSSYFFEDLPNTRKLAASVTVPNDWATVATLDEALKDPNGQLLVEHKSNDTELVRYSKNNEKRFPLRNYMFRIKVPSSYAGKLLRIRATGGKVAEKHMMIIEKGELRAGPPRQPRNGGIPLCYVATAGRPGNFTSISYRGLVPEHHQVRRHPASAEELDIRNRFSLPNISVCRASWPLSLP